MPAVILLGPISAGEKSPLPGLVLCGMSLVGLLAIPAEIKKVKSKESTPLTFAILIVITLALAIAGLVILTRKF
jgi:hypothetical protein